MTKTKSATQALLELKCPRCREGQVFKYPNKKLSKFNKMHDDCPHCGLHYEIEPGFFWGAMFISYALTVAIVAFCGVFTYVVFDNPRSPWVYITNCLIALFLMSPITFRYSRMLMLYLFSGIGFDESKARQDA